MLSESNIIRNRSYDFGRLPETVVIGTPELSSQMVVYKYVKNKCLYLFVMISLLGLCQLAVLPNIHRIFDLITMPPIPPAPSMPQIPKIPQIPTIPSIPSLPDTIWREPETK
jgi:hypothetical protein